VWLASLSARTGNGRLGVAVRPASIRATAEILAPLQSTTVSRPPPNSHRITFVKDPRASVQQVYTRVDAFQRWSANVGVRICASDVFNCPSVNATLHVPARHGLIANPFHRPRPMPAPTCCGRLRALAQAGRALQRSPPLFRCTPATLTLPTGMYLRHGFRWHLPPVCAYFQARMVLP
jgi:hypothetical protein